MSYNPSTDFVGLWRAQAAGAVKAEMPGLDFVLAALKRAGMYNVVFSSTAPAANQATTAWFNTATPSNIGEGVLYLWDVNALAYVPATPDLFITFMRSGSSAVPVNTVKNYIVNSAMQVSQENGTTGGTTNGYFGADQFSYNFANTAGVCTSAQAGALTAGGSTTRLRTLVTTIDATVDPNDAAWIEHRIEGSRLGDLLWNSASALRKTVTLQFGVRTAAGIYSIAILNNLANMFYVGEYTISSGEHLIDTIKTIVIPPPPTSSWLLVNVAGMIIRWGLMAGSNRQGPANAWTATAVDAVGSPNQFNLLSVNANPFDLFDVSLTEGSGAPAYKLVDNISELTRCKRYYQKLAGQMIETIPTNIILPVEMRLNPTIGGGGAGFTVNSPSNINPQVSQTARAAQTLTFNARL